MVLPRALTGFARTLSKEHESTDNSEIFHEIRHLDLPHVSTPIRVIHDGCQDGENNEHPGAATPMIVEHEHESSAELKDNGNHQRYTRERHRETDIAESEPDKLRGFFEIYQEPESFDNKNERQEHAWHILLHDTSLSFAHHTLDIMNLSLSPLYSV